MQGHTDKTTINQRKPLTDNMRKVLRQVGDRTSGSGLFAKPPRRGLYPNELGQAEKNATRALLDRALITWDNGCWLITEAGRAALASPQEQQK